MKIFVAIAAFYDPYLLHTVQDAFSKAKYPEKLVFGIVDQYPDDRRQRLKEIGQTAMIRYVRLDPVESRGVCWARSIVYSLYQNETYLLQIDSHMLFEPNWDEQLMQGLESLRPGFAKPILTTYPYGFEFIDDKPIVNIKVSNQTTLVLRPNPETQLTEDNATLRFQAEHIFSRHTIMGAHIAGGFMFTLGRFTQEIPYDPYLYFHGEEQNLAIRAFTHGWDIFHPPHIPLFHLYKMPDTDHQSHHWHPTWEKERDYVWSELAEKAKQRLMDLVYRRKDLGVYGLGSARSLDDFAQLTGIDYTRKHIIERCYQPRYTLN